MLGSNDAPTIHTRSGSIGPIERDSSSRHRRYREEDLDTLQALACLRAMGVGIVDMRTYQANRARGHEAAGEGATPTDHSQRPGQAGARLAPPPGRDHDRRDRREPAGYSGLWCWAPARGMLCSAPAADRTETP
jgi:DNA-binding transcriptional MerR regulator